ncbi:MAG: monovalent cation/H(+) antiporter subunit G [Agarilytica sp.]
MILDVLSWLFLLSGGFLCVSGAVGVQRFPDFFSRMHAASVTDTLGSGLILLGLMFQTEHWLIVSKLLFIMLFIFFTSPTSGHALAKAAIHAGMRPWKKGDARR